MSKNKICLFLIAFSLLSTLIPFGIFSVWAQDENTTTDEEKQINELNEKINKYTAKINELSGRANTLSNEVEYMNDQINLTELRCYIYPRLRVFLFLLY